MLWYILREVVEVYFQEVDQCSYIIVQCIVGFKGDGIGVVFGVCMYWVLFIGSCIVFKVLGLVCRLISIDICKLQWQCVVDECGCFNVSSYWSNDKECYIDGYQGLKWIICFQFVYQIVNFGGEFCGVQINLQCSVFVDCYSIVCG